MIGSEIRCGIKTVGIAKRERNERRQKDAIARVFFVRLITTEKNAKLTMKHQYPNLLQRLLPLVRICIVVALALLCRRGRLCHLVVAHICAVKAGSDKLTPNECRLLRFAQKESGRVAQS